MLFALLTPLFSYLKVRERAGVALVSFEFWSSSFGMTFQFCLFQFWRVCQQLYGAILRFKFGGLRRLFFDYFGFSLILKGGSISDSVKKLHRLAVQNTNAVWNFYNAVSNNCLTFFLGKWCWWCRGRGTDQTASSCWQCDLETGFITIMLSYATYRNIWITTIIIKY